jgi:hypothetical protein
MKNGINEIEKINMMKDKLKNSKTINLSLVNRNIMKTFEKKNIFIENLGTEILTNNLKKSFNQHELITTKKQIFNTEISYNNNSHLNEIFQRKFKNCNLSNKEKEEEEKENSKNILFKDNLNLNLNPKEESK